MQAKLGRYQKFTWFVLLYNILVVLFGAFVRATGSGAGCGAHWPLCNGVVVPRPEQVETIIEFTHRLTSGITIILIAVLFTWTWKKYSAGSLTRRFSFLAVVFTIIEALVGAGLVLFQLVGQDDSVHRAVMMAFHLVNTFFLLASLAITAWSSSYNFPRAVKTSFPYLLPVVIGILAILLLGASGAVTALGDTLFPSSSLVEGIQEDFSATAHFLVRMRIYHPGIAVGVGIYLLFITSFFRAKYPRQQSLFLAKILLTTYLIQLLLGAINVFLLAPIWMQIIHLLFSTVIWIFFILLIAEVYFGFSSRLDHQDVHKSVY